MYGLQTAPSPRRTNCKIQRNIKYKVDNLGGGGGGEKFWMKIYIGIPTTILTPTLTLTLILIPLPLPSPPPLPLPLLLPLPSF